MDEAILKSDQGSSAFVVGVKSSEKSPKETAGQREHRSGQQMHRGGSCRKRWEKESLALFVQSDISLSKSVREYNAKTPQDT